MTKKTKNMENDGAMPAWNTDETAYDSSEQGSESQALEEATTDTYVQHSLSVDCTTSLADSCTSLTCDLSTSPQGS